MANKKKWGGSIGVKLTVVLMILAIVCINFLGIVSFNTASNAIEKQVFDQVSAIGKLKSKQITSFFHRKYRDVEVLAKSQNVIDSYKKLKQYHDKSEAQPNGQFDSESSEYSVLYNEMDPFFRQFQESYNFNNLYFICAPHGHVMYSVSRGSDLGTNLVMGEYKNSALAKLWKKVVANKKTVLTDISLNEASNENYALIGTPVFDNNGELNAVLVLQLSLEKINEIMNDNTGLGETGESYLVGQDYLMRSDSRFGSGPTILKQKVNTKSVELALNHQSGQHIIDDYRGVSVLSYYGDLRLNENFDADFEWAVVTEIAKTEAFASNKILIRKIIIVGIIIALVVMFISIMIARYFTKPILELVRVTELLAGGDLTQEIVVTSNDEIGSLGNSFKIMQENLRKQLEELKEGVNVLSSSSSEITAMMAQLASGSAETATSVSETTITIEEVKQTVDVSAQKSTEVSETAQKISTISQQGKRSVEETIEGMNRIKQQMELIAGIVIQLSEKSKTIGEIANNVNDLAEQSNLLAVNASIEAAKAGEQGKGFSVVAQEIKNLATRSKDSTVQIRTILSDIQKEITNAVMATEQGGKVIDAGLKLSSTANEVISVLAAGVEQTSEANMHIAASSRQQLTGMDQIATAMENIKEASHQATEGTMQTQESINELKNLGEKLLHMLNQYKID